MIVMIFMILINWKISSKLRSTSKLKHCLISFAHVACQREKYIPIIYHKIKNAKVRGMLQNTYCPHVLSENYFLSSS